MRRAPRLKVRARSDALRGPVGGSDPVLPTRCRLINAGADRGFEQSGADRADRGFERVLRHARAWSCAHAS
eukprot:697308-Prorocentrum_minimum.AAC.4